MHDDNELPVLSAIVKTGNESIIQSTRLGHEVLDELEAMRRDCQGATLRHGSAPFDLRPGRGDGSVVHLLAEAQTQSALDVESIDDPDRTELARRVHEIVDRHSDAMRRDLLALLARGR